MKYRKLGNTGLTVSEIGFGAWGIGGLTKGKTSYGPVDDQESLRALQAAFDKGVTFYDTADLYGYGHSEELIGAAFKGKRDKVVIATKAGYLEHDGPQNFSPTYLCQALEKSLKRLQTDYIDLFQLHDPPIELVAEVQEIIGTLTNLQKQRKIRSWGISVRSPNDGLIAVRQLQAPVIQVNFNMIDQRIIENGLLDLAAAHNTGIIARTPLCFGFLSGKLSDLRFDPRDHRNAWPTEQLKRWSSAPALFEDLNKGKDRTLAQLAFSFCLSYQAVSCVIPGMITVQEVEENAASVAVEPLTELELRKIRDIYQQHEFFDKTAKPDYQISGAVK